MKVSVIMPVFNERATLEQVVRRVMGSRIKGVDDLELIAVDDASIDGSGVELARLTAFWPERLKVLKHEVNRGKGAAVRTGLASARGEIVLIQDADMEYDPAEYPLLLDPIVDGRADAVYGSRFSGQQAKRVLYFWHYAGNCLLTLLSNMANNLNLTDMETGFKAFRRGLVDGVQLRSERFGFEPEITAVLARRGARMFEVGISYNGRTYDQGKKITWLDGVRALGTIVRCWLARY